MELKNVEIIKIGTEQTFGSGFRKIEFVVKDDSSQYPQEIPFSITQDKIDNFVKFNKVGQRVDINFNLNGRSWLKEGDPEGKRRWFTDLNAWKVVNVGGEAPEPLPTHAEQESDDLPF